MLEWLRGLTQDKLTVGDVMAVGSLFNVLTGQKPVCPYSEFVKIHGVEARVLNGTRRDN